MELGGTILSYRLFPALTGIMAVRVYARVISKPAFHLDPTSWQASRRSLLISLHISYL